MRRGTWLAVALVVLASAPPAIAQRGAAVLHEPIPADARDDVAAGLSLDGDFPAGIQTPRGVVSAPDPTRPFGSGDAPYSTAPKNDGASDTLRPDRNTQRPDQLPYDDPFSPSTAPFKRLSAFDAVDSSYTLYVRESHVTTLAISKALGADASEEQFFADMVVDLEKGRRVRIPSVGPGARVFSARAGVGAQDVRFSLSRDGAENWFIEGEVSTRARLVMEVSIQRAAFGGDFGNPSRAELLPVVSLPPNVSAAAAIVSQKIGVSKRQSPRDVVTKLVTYFRNFKDSDDPPSGRGDIYLDLALSQKGVCRHRAFAFMITALHVGIPTRMVKNEAHAWVEVHDGRLWRRIDLGGAGRTLHDPLSTNVPYEPPPDPFAWPQGASRGEDLGERARQRAPRDGAATAPSGGGNGSASPATSGSASGGASSGGAPGSSGAATGGGGASSSTTSSGRSGPDDRPASIVTMTLTGAEARRGSPFRLKGSVAAEGEPCAHVGVEIVLRGRGEEIVVGSLATDERGNYDGALVLPPSVPLGDYDAIARTFGDTRCGRGVTR